MESCTQTWDPPGVLHRGTKKIEAAVYSQAGKFSLSESIFALALIWGFYSWLTPSCLAVSTRQTGSTGCKVPTAALGSCFWPLVLCLGLSKQNEVLPGKRRSKAWIAAKSRLLVMSNFLSWPQHKGKWRLSVSKRSSDISGNPFAAAVRHDMKLRTLQGQQLTSSRCVRKIKIFCSASEIAGSSAEALYFTQQS